MARTRPVLLLLSLLTAAALPARPALAQSPPSYPAPASGLPANPYLPSCVPPVFGGPPSSATNLRSLLLPLLLTNESPLADPANDAEDQADPAHGGELRPDPEGQRRSAVSLRSKTQGSLGTLTSLTVLEDKDLTHDEPVLGEEWKTDQSWQLPLGSSLFVFGQLGAGSVAPEGQDLKVAGRTGLAWKLTDGSGPELLIRGGPLLMWTDPLRVDRTLGRSELFIELQCRVPLSEQLGLEYLGSATPGLSPEERDRFNQELRFNLPVGRGGKLQVGARHRWENVPANRVLGERFQVFFGVELGR